MRWELLKTILWLRWRLSWNQVAKAGTFTRVFATLATIASAVGVVGAGIGGFLLGYFVFARTDATAIMYAMDAVVLGFLFVWMIGIVADVQRSELIDLQRLMHLPVSLRDAFAVNYLASHVSVSLGLAVPAVGGLGIGLAVARDPLWLLLPALFLAFVFCVSAWTYCLRGWLVQLMVNPRRRRWIIMLLTGGMIVVLQAPNLFFNVYLRQQRGKEREMVERLQKQKQSMEKAHAYVPPFWVGWGAAQAEQGRWWPACGALVVFGFVGGLGLRRAYRSTLRFYRGESHPRAAGRASQSDGDIARARKSIALLEGRLPFVSEAAAAAAFAFLRSMQRAPETKIVLLGPVAMLGFVAFMVFGRNAGARLVQFGPLFSLGMSAFALMTAAPQILFNQFGWDRHGFRALVLSPVERRDLLVAKNLSSGLFVLVLGIIIQLLLGLVVRLSAVQQVAGVIQVLTVTLILCGVGNAISILLPFRVHTGSLKPTKPPLKVVLIMMVVTLLTPVYLLPAFAGPLAGLLAAVGLSPWASLLNLLVSGAVLGLVALGYVLTLRPLGRLLRERELKILDTVTAEVE